MAMHDGDGTMQLRGQAAPIRDMEPIVMPSCCAVTRDATVLFCLDEDRWECEDCHEAHGPLDMDATTKAETIARAAHLGCHRHD
jgi:hypothetical protein